MTHAYMSSSASASASSPSDGQRERSAQQPTLNFPKIRQTKQKSTQFLCDVKEVGQYGGPEGQNTVTFQGHGRVL